MESYSLYIPNEYVLYDATKGAHQTSLLFYCYFIIAHPTVTVTVTLTLLCHSLCYLLSLFFFAFKAAA